MKYKKYLYSKGKILLLVNAIKKPSNKTAPRSGTWVVNEWNGKEFLMPCFPEIMLETLNKFSYIGELK